MNLGWFQFRLWHLFAAMTFVGLLCFISVLGVEDFAAGSEDDLPPAERLLITALRQDGLAVRDQFT